MVGVARGGRGSVIQQDGQELSGSFDQLSPWVTYQGIVVPVCVCVCVCVRERERVRVYIVGAEERGERNSKQIYTVTEMT